MGEAFDGSATCHRLHTPYGTARYSSGASPTTLGYTGQRADSATGLDDYHARYYDPAAGQFTSADTANDGLNRYGYVHGNPATYSDPSGHRAWDFTGGEGSFYQSWKDIVQQKGITGAVYISPNVKEINSVSSPETLQAASNLAVQQDLKGGVNGKYPSGWRVATGGTAVVYVAKWNEQNHEYEPMLVKTLGIVWSKGTEDPPQGHAEGKAVAEILNWIAGFRAQHGSETPGTYRFGFDMIITKAPCNTCTTKLPA